MSRVLLALVAFVLALTVSGCAELAVGAGNEQAQGGKQAVAEPTPEPTKPPLRVDDLVGEDGRLTRAGAGQRLP